MKKYQVKIRDVVIEIEQDDDGKFIMPEFIRNYQSYGTQLKPSYEPIIVARKPVENSIIDNVIKYGVGGINIDECRVDADNNYLSSKGNEKNKENSNNIYQFNSNKLYIRGNPNNLGRFPANVILTYDDTDFEEVCGGMPNTKSGDISKEYKQETRFNIAETGKGGNLDYSNCYGDEGSASRYFYCAKASKFDRDEGLEELEAKRKYVDSGTRKPEGKSIMEGSNVLSKNIHPTVKPCELMRYLVRLVSPKGATILDCFNGSGSTGKAVMLENKQYKKDYKYIGIELTEEYLPISKARIEYICNNDFDFYKDENGQEKREVVDKSVTTLFDLEF